MENRTKHYFQKLLARRIFGPENYTRIKFLKIYVKYLTGGDYEIAGFLKRVIESGEVFFDIGANLGQYALRLGRINSGSTRIYLFEPFKANYEILVKHFSLKGNIIIENKAVSDFNGAADLFIPVIEDILIDTQATINQNDRPTEYEIYKKEKSEVIKIDEYMIQKKVDRIDYIKIDTEGHDDRVILGAAETISKYYPVIMTEDAPSGEAVQLLRRLNYTEYFAAKRGTLIRVESAEVSSGVNRDLVINIPEFRMQKFTKYIAEK